jgi:hypothetical protein
LEEWALVPGALSAEERIGDGDEPTNAHEIRSLERKLYFKAKAGVRRHRFNRMAQTASVIWWFR